MSTPPSSTTAVAMVSSSSAPLSPHASFSSGGGAASSSSSSSSSGATGGKVVNRPTYFSHGASRFLIMDSPTDQNLPAYVELLTKKHVVTLVRACEPSYSTAPLAKAGIAVHELPFADGDPPSAEVIANFLALCDQTFGPMWTTSAPATATATATASTSASPTGDKEEGDDKSAIAVHCVAGLGRAPVLVAIALMECGMPHIDCVSFIRRKRRGAINAKQIKFLESYQRRQPPAACCVIL